MQYLLMIYSEQGAWEKLTPAAQQQGMAAYNAFTEALRKSGALAGSNRLRPTSTATTVRIADGKSQVLDGPYADTKEQLAGYYLIDDAVACPRAAGGPGQRSVEVRPVWSMPE